MANWVNVSSNKPKEKDTWTDVGTYETKKTTTSTTTTKPITKPKITKPIVTQPKTTGYSYQERPKNAKNITVNSQVNRGGAGLSGALGELNTMKNTFNKNVSGINVNPIGMVKDTAGLTANLALDVVKTPLTLARYTANAIQGKQNKPMALEKTLSNVQKVIADVSGYKKDYNMDTKQGGVMDAMNYINRGQQGIYGGVQALQKNKNIIKSVNAGLSGKTDIYGGTLLRNAGMSKSKGIGYDDVLGTVIDIFADPANAIPIGAVSKLFKGAKEAKTIDDAVKIAEKAKEELINAGKLDKAQELDNIIKQVPTNQVDNVITPNKAITDTLTPNKVNIPTEVKTPAVGVKNAVKSDVKVKVSKKVLENNIKDAAGEPVQGVLARLAGVDARNMMNKTKGLPLEKYPYEKNVLKMVKDYENSGISSSYLYHTTPSKNVESIMEKGITTNNKPRYDNVSGVNKVYLAADEQLAKEFGTEKDILFRIDNRFDIKDLEEDLIGGQGTYSTNKLIPPEALQIKENGKWVMLKNSKMYKDKASSISKPIKSISQADQIVKDIPKETKSRGFATTVITDKNTPKEVVKELKAKNDVYVIQTDKATLDKATKHIEELGFDKSLTGVQNKFKTGERFTKEDTTTMELLYKQAVENGDYELATDIISDLAVLGTEMGQSIQALGMITKLSPAGRLKTLEKKMNRINSQLTPKQLNKMKKTLGTDKVTLPKEVKEAILKAKPGEELDNLVNAAVINIASQEPLTLGDKLRSWRYLSMLGNPRTHIRNIVGNTAMKTIATGKNKLSGAIEDVVSRFIPIERTKTFGIATKEMKDFAKQDALSIKTRIVGTNKYDLGNQKRAFDGKISNTIAQGSSGLLEKEDWLFSGRAYQQAFANYMKANKLTSEFLKSGSKEANLILEKGRNVAVKEAQEQTFRQYSKLASNIAHFEDMNAGTKLVVGAILPFKKTPINIAKTGYQYSPARLVQSIFDFKKIAQATPVDKPELITNAIDGLAKGLSGTGIMGLGFGLASTGAITASGPTNRKEAMLEQSQGKQPYSVSIFGKNYTLDWLSPAAMPLFAGVELYNQINNEETVNSDKVLSRATQTMEAMSKLMDPLTSMSLLQGVNNTLQTFNAKETPGGYVGSLIMNTVQNYAGQFIPTVSGQLARTIDTKRRDTTASGTGIDKVMGTFVNKQKAKIPFASKTLEPYTNQLGQE